jgi:hypothetical protein
MLEEEVLQSSSAISTHVDRRELQRRFDVHRVGTSDESYSLWAGWVLERWLSTVGAGSRRAPHEPAPA